MDQSESTSRDIEQWLSEADFTTNQPAVDSPVSAGKPLTPTLLGELADCEKKYVLLRSGAKQHQTPRKCLGVKVHRHIENALKARYFK